MTRTAPHGEWNTAPAPSPAAGFASRPRRFASRPAAFAPRPAAPSPALINFDGADEVVDSRHTSHISGELISAVEVDQRGAGEVGKR